MAFNQLTYHVADHIVAKRLRFNCKFDHFPFLSNVECLDCAHEGAVRIHPGTVDTVHVLMSDVIVEH
jgi:hypothetical protein